MLPGVENTRIGFVKIYLTGARRITGVPITESHCTKYKDKFLRVGYKACGSSLPVSSDLCLTSLRHLNLFTLSPSMGSTLMPQDLCTGCCSTWNVFLPGNCMAFLHLLQKSPLKCPHLSDSFLATRSEFASPFPSLKLPILLFCFVFLFSTYSLACCIFYLLAYFIVCLTHYHRNQSTACRPNLAYSLLL